MSILRSLLCGYFNQDWQSEFDSAEDVIADFLSEKWTSRELMKLSDEIEGMISQVYDDFLIEHSLLSSHNCYYLPSSDGLSARAWLIALADRFRAEGAKRSA